MLDCKILYASNYVKKRYASDVGSKFESVSPLSNVGRIFVIDERKFSREKNFRANLPRLSHVNFRIRNNITLYYRLLSLDREALKKLGSHNGSMLN